jgi:hypothetical protein
MPVLDLFEPAMTSPTPHYVEGDLKALDLDSISDAATKSKAAIGSVMTTGPPDDDDDEFDFWRFKDLKERNIVSDRADLFRKQQRGFPKAVKFSKGQGAVALFRKRAVKQWVRANMNSAGPDNPTRSSVKSRKVAS